jgi:hypothetical protein
MLIGVLEKIQKKLKLLKRQRLVFGRLEGDKDILYIETGKWWAHPMRHNLLTAFLKDALSDNIDSAITNGSGYLERTKDAIEKFLDGNVYYGGDFFEGWVDDFQYGNHLNLLQDKPNKNDTLQVRFYAGWKIHSIQIDKD